MPRPVYSLNCHGRLVEIDRPWVMGILNVTPDSFYAESRQQSDEQIARRCHEIVDQGGTVIDIGGYSSRPGAADVEPAEELARLRRGLQIAQREVPGTLLSVDTFRADVARACVEEFGADIVNDIGGGTLDSRMLRTVARLGVPYVLTHLRGTPQDMQLAPSYDDVVTDVFQFFARQIQALRDMGAKDVILDPGFGFGKTLEHNYTLMAHLGELEALGLPVLVGVSRKSMVCRLLDCTPQQALNGTTALHAVALMKGAAILRVHDVKAAVEAVNIVEAVGRAGTEKQPPTPNTRH